jgi:glycosyltransferase involved in cell wall biosynthesis
MKILCIIDSLGSGGAQRQIVNLACGLKAKGHVVEMFVYFPELRFFREEINAASIPVHEVHKSKGFSLKVLGKLIYLMRTGKYDTLISFLNTPNIYVELARIIARPRLRLIVSERNSFIKGTASPMEKLTRYLHVCADAVVANSLTQANCLRKHSWLQHKSHVIYNGYQITTTNKQERHDAERDLTAFLIVGRIDAEQKNGVRLLEALVLFYQRNGYTPKVSWAGRQEFDSKSLKVRAEIERLLNDNPQVSMHWQWLGERTDIPQLMANCDALIHVSLFEGLPNVVCEALIAGRPVIASNVCDHPILVEDGVRGLLCDPLSPLAICEAIELFESLDAHERHAMGINARRYAEENLTLNKMVIAYEELIFAS